MIYRIGLRGKLRISVRSLYNNPNEKSLSLEQVMVVGWYKAVQFSVFEGILNKISARLDMSYERK